MLHLKNTADYQHFEGKKRERHQFDRTAHGTHQVGHALHLFTSIYRPRSRLFAVTALIYRHLF